MKQAGSRNYDTTQRDVKRASGCKQEWIKAVTKAGIGCLLLALVYFILTYVADFSSRQGLTVVVLMVAGIGFADYQAYYQAHTIVEQIENDASKPPWRFTPYWVRVFPEWQQILTDFKLITTPHDWEEIKPAIYDAVPYGISYTVLQRSDDHQSQIIFRAERKDGFVSEVNFCDEVAPIEFEDVPKTLRLFMKSRGDRYDLGIIVPQKWWDRVKGGCPKPVREASGERWYEAELTLAALSYIEFDWYWQPEGGASPGTTFRGDPQYYLYEEWRQKITSQRDKQRVEFGWEEGKYGGIVHSYFELQHRRI